MENNRYDSIEDIAAHCSDDFKAENPHIFGLHGVPPSPRVRIKGDDRLENTTNKMHVAPKEKRIYKGITFKSKKEVSKAAELDLSKLAGEIKGYIMQVGFMLPGKTKSGRPIRHYVDFGVIELDDKVTWIEVKGRDLELGRLKRAQVEEIYGITIKVE